MDRKRKQRFDAEKKTGEYRNKEAAKRGAASNARAAALKATSGGTKASKLREAERAERDAATAGKQAAAYQDQVRRYAREELALQVKLSKAEQAEAHASEQNRSREQQRMYRSVAAERLSFERRLTQTQSEVQSITRLLREPKSERLRILLLGAASGGDLRVGREQKRIRAAVQATLHRDLIKMDVRPAATTSDLLDGITRFRPHIVHFSGHSGDELIVFEDERDEPHEGVIVTASAFGAAIGATDEPPLLVLLNSCNSASQAADLVAEIVPFSIGMAGEIDDGDAIAYAAQFYAAVGNGQSIRSAHLAGQASLKLAGLSGSELPTLAHAPDVDPGATMLVRPDE